MNRLSDSTFRPKTIAIAANLPRWISRFAAFGLLGAAAVLPTHGAAPFAIEPPDIPNRGILFVDHEATGRSGHGGHAIVEAANGNILAFYSNVSGESLGGHGISGWTEYKISGDGGTTWSEARVLEPSRRIREGDEHHSALVDEVMTAPDGSLVAIATRYQGYWNGGFGMSWRRSTPVFFRSFDHGETWTEAREIHPGAGVDQIATLRASLVREGELLVLFNSGARGAGENNPHRLYVSTDNGETFRERSTLPFDSERWYGAMTVLPDGQLVVYTYHESDEHNIHYATSADAGRTWSEVNTTHLAKRIRNPQLSERIFGRYFLHGRSGHGGDDPRHLVLYTSEDGLNWDEGVFLNRGERDLDSYSTNAIVGRRDPDHPERLLIQASIAYDPTGRKVNIHHWWIEGFGETTAEPVSLLDQAWTGKYDWIRDFRYQRIMTGAPESTPQRRIALGGAERSHYPAYTMRMKGDHVRSLLDSPWVISTASADENLIIGQSRGWEANPYIFPQPIYGYKITDPETDGDKLSVVLAGGNHGREHPACWALHAMVDFLVSDDPRAAALRRKAVFYVYPAVNPDGKSLLWSREDPFHHADGSPELAAAGHRNHNRIWHTDGLSASADIVKAAMKRDTDGRVDYLFDFHGVPHTTFFFTSGGTSPYSDILLGMEPSLNLRQGAHNEAWLRSWAMSPEGLNATHAYTPEVANPNKEYLFMRGKQFALALYKLVSGIRPKPAPWTVAPAEMTMPPKPAAAWLFKGNARPAGEGMPPGNPNGVSWSRTTRFAHPDNRSVRLDKTGGQVDLGQPSRLDATEQLTVAFWVKSDFSADSGEIPVLARSRASGNQRSWALTFDAESGELLLTLSSDGSYGWDRIKRMRTAVWPLQTIFDGRWRHLAFTFDGSVRDPDAEPDRSTTPERVGGPGAARIFLDGIELRKGAGSHVFANGSVESLHVPDAPILLGSGPEAEFPFEGLVDELGIWTTALTAGEIHWLAHHSLREITRPLPGVVYP